MRSPLLLATLAACAVAPDDDGDTDTDGDTDVDTLACPRPLAPVSSPPARLATSDDPAVAALATSVNQLGAGLLRELDPATNSAFSPLSVHGMFATLLPATSGDTADALADVLAIDQPLADHHAALSGLLRELDDTSRGWGFEWGASFWHRPSLTVEAGWLDEVGPLYDVSPVPTDFQGDPEAARTAMNTWVSDHTRCLIPEFYPPSYDFSRTVHIALHAMALEARWAEPFDAAFTRDRPFHLAGGGTVSVPTMESKEFVGRVADDGDRVVVRLPYQGDDLAMYLVVPDEPSDPTALLTDLDADQLDAWAALPPRQGSLAIRLPKWSTTSTHLLIPALETLGYGPLIAEPLPALCDGCALPDIVRQVVVVLVDEEGTRAAAATSGETTDSEPEWTDVDRPFLWFLRDDASGVVLWVGWVGDPS